MIGQRHISNLMTLGIEDIFASDTRADRLADVASRFDIQTVRTLEQGWELAPNVAIIATPSSLHIQQALEAARHGCHLFVEKPLGDRLDGVEELLSIVDENKLVSLVGCNMRFHHGPATIKKLLEKSAIGKVITALLDSGQYLPDWHPGEDYRQGYSANASMGGGVVLDGIHEIDYAYWLFGEVDEVYSQGGKLSSLEIDTEDNVNILMKMAGSFSVAVHLDYIQRAYSRSCKVVGEDGTIVWDIDRGEVRLYSAWEQRWESFPEPQGYTINQMYIDEMDHFLRCLRGDEKPVAGVHQAKRVLEIALATKDSMQSGQVKRVAVGLT